LLKNQTVIIFNIPKSAIVPIIIYDTPNPSAISSLTYLEINYFHCKADFLVCLVPKPLSFAEGSGLCAAATPQGLSRKRHFNGLGQKKKYFSVKIYFPVETKGRGCRDTFLKYRIYIPNMDCEYCEKPNLFNCLIINGSPIPIKCHDICKGVWLE